jgi:hypothetical protein
MKNVFYCLAGLLILSCCIWSCSTEEAIEQVFGSVSAQSPVFLACQAVSAEELDFRFSLPVKVVSLSFDPPVQVASIVNGSMVRVNLGEILGPGEKHTADLLVEDEKGNTLNVLIPFRARNDRMPSFIITELRTEYTKADNKSGTKYNSEFVEFKTLSAGNLGALRLFIAGNTKQPLIMEFPPVEVASGEYIVIHLRTYEEGAQDELGENLDLSGGTDAGDTARDFWIPGKTKLLHKTDAVYFLDQDDKAVDAVMLSEKPDVWSKEQFMEAANFLHSQGAWFALNGAPKIPGPQDAAATGTATTTRTICRDEDAADTNKAGDWYVTVTSGATPGARNNPGRYVPK